MRIFSVLFLIIFLSVMFYGCTYHGGRHRNVRIEIPVNEPYPDHQYDRHYYNQWWSHSYDYYNKYNRHKYDRNGR